MRLLKNIYNRTSFLIAYIRGKYWGLFLKKIGKDVSIMPNCLFYSPEKISIGSHVFINRNCVIGQGAVTIGNYVSIGFNTIILAQNHQFTNLKKPIALQGYKEERILIDDDVWIGANAVILSGVHVGKGSVIGAGAVVTKDIPPFSIAGGVPAKVIKYRFDKETIKKAERIKFV